MIEIIQPVKGQIKKGNTKCIWLICILESKTITCPKLNYYVGQPTDSKRFNWHLRFLWSKQWLFGPSLIFCDTHRADANWYTSLYISRQNNKPVTDNGHHSSDPNVPQNSVFSDLAHNGSPCNVDEHILRCVTLLLNSERSLSPSKT